MAQSPLGREGAQECDAVARFPPLDRVAHVALEVELINEARASRGKEGGQHGELGPLNVHLEDHKVAPL